jgi:hypothetical protein
MITQSEVEEVARALLANRSITRDVLRAGEQHYTPIIKRALADASLGGADVDSLSDDEAENIKWAVRDATAICEGRAHGGARAPSDPSNRRAVCRALEVIGDDLSDALAISSALLTVGAVLASAATPLAYALIGVSLVRMGIRAVCKQI